MKVIYTVFYKRLKSYDGDDVNLELRLKILELCVASYRRCNPDVSVIVEYVDEVIENTAMMYFDKMRRIKELNRNFDVLWVDGDTLCLENIGSIFDRGMITGTFWGFWDSFNLLNGGFIYYPKRSLYDKWNFFEDEWIKLLSEHGKMFIGPYEQMPITNLYLKQFSDLYNYKEYSIFTNFEKMMEDRFLFDIEYNYNPLINNRFYRSDRYDFKCNSILRKKVLHMNTSLIYKNNMLHFIEYVYDNLIGYSDDDTKLLKRCTELKILNSDMRYSIVDKTFSIDNPTLGYIKVFLFKNTKDFDLSRSVSQIVSPGHYCKFYDYGDEDNILIKNILSGESTII